MDETMNNVRVKIADIYGKFLEEAGLTEAEKEAFYNMTASNYFNMDITPEDRERAFSSNVGPEMLRWLENHAEEAHNIGFLYFFSEGGEYLPRLGYSEIILVTDPEAEEIPQFSENEMLEMSREDTMKIANSYMKNIETVKEDIKIRRGFDEADSYVHNL